MKTEFSITSDLASSVVKWFDLSLSSDEMRSQFETWIAETCYTQKTSRFDGGKPRYRKGFIASLNAFYIALKESHINNYCVFGYWYKSEFYSTYRSSNELVKNNNLKTTNELHDLKLDQQIWDSLPRGMYYAKSLKPHYCK